MTWHLSFKPQFVYGKIWQRGGFVRSGECLFLKTHGSWTVLPCFRRVEGFFFGWEALEQHGALDIRLVAGDHSWWGTMVEYPSNEEAKAIILS